MAGAAGLEPVTSAVTGQRSNQLSYAPAQGTRTVGKLSLIVNVYLEFCPMVFKRPLIALGGRDVVSVKRRRMESLALNG